MKFFEKSGMLRGRNLYFLFLKNAGRAWEREVWSCIQGKGAHVIKNQ